MAARNFGADGTMLSDITMTIASAGTETFMIYNDSNRNMIVHINAGAGTTLNFPVSSYQPEPRTQMQATQEEFQLESGECIVFTATAAADGNNFNVDNLFTRVRHNNDGLLRHYRNPRSDRTTNRIPGADPGRLILDQITV